MEVVTVIGQLATRSGHYQQTDERATHARALARHGSSTTSIGGRCLAEPRRPGLGARSGRLLGGRGWTGLLADAVVRADDDFPESSSWFSAVIEPVRTGRCQSSPPDCSSQPAPTQGRDAVSPALPLPPVDIRDTGGGGDSPEFSSAWLDLVTRAHDATQSWTKYHRAANLGVVDLDQEAVRTRAASTPTSTSTSTPAAATQSRPPSFEGGLSERRRRFTGKVVSYT